MKIKPKDFPGPIQTDQSNFNIVGQLNATTGNNLYEDKKPHKKITKKNINIFPNNSPSNTIPRMLQIAQTPPTVTSHTKTSNIKQSFPKQKIMAQIRNIFLQKTISPFIPFLQIFFDH
eukprot:TRINITY_DN60953_c0_g1_i1.p1 TRINITY_DN60953_c0_g1~~TRINITY_DN60953_c0_g1_i1.p1  ORF type:complete len:118 (+),score=2.66 TRINITY_DN60953_c0_g1_i1:246-599(+)